jgi:hypothetical protein
MLLQNKGNAYLLEINNMFDKKTMPNRNIDDWVRCFLLVRTKARKAFAEVKHYGAMPVQDFPINKREEKNRNKDFNKEKPLLSNHQKADKAKQKYLSL